MFESKEKKNSLLDGKLNSRVGKVFTLVQIKSHIKQEELLLGKCS